MIKLLYIFKQNIHRIKIPYFRIITEQLVHMIHFQYKPLTGVVVQTKTAAVRIKNLLFSILKINYF